MPAYPLTGTNIDFASLPEVLSALQRNPQVQRAIVGAANLSTAFVGTTVYAVVGAGSALLTLTDVTQCYRFVAPGLVFPFGAPLAYDPPGGNVVAAVSTTGAPWVVLYK